MKRFKVTGMSCAVCQNSVEKAVLSVEGVKSCNVSLLTNSLTVEGNADDNLIIAAVTKAGYGVEVINDNVSSLNSKNKSDKTLLRLIISAFLLLVLMYFSMGYTMFNFPLPSIFAQKPALVCLIQIILSTAVIVINNKFFINGFKGLIKLSPNMDTLVAMGSGASFIYSVTVVLKVLSAQKFGDIALASSYLHELYFEAAAMILTLVTVGKYLESLQKERTTLALTGLINLKPLTATVIRNGKEVKVSASEVLVDDIFIVRPGEKIPADAVVVKGQSAIDESALTGESIPSEKSIDSKVYSATTNISGYLECRATNVGDDTVLSKIIQIVSDTMSSKAPIARVADKVASVFVPCVLIIAIITFLAWFFVENNVGFSLARAISVLVISCPCALGLATPVAITVGNGVAAKLGILFKNAAAIETCGKIKNVILDKTGTVTNGKPVVTDVIPFENISEKELLEFAFSLEKQSEHPLAVAVNEYCKNNNIDAFEIVDFKSISGNGVSAIYDNKTLSAGKKEFISDFTELNDEALSISNKLAGSGKTPLYFALDGKFLGIIAVADTLKADSISAIENLKLNGYNVVMLTGDNEITAQAIGNSAGINKIYANVLPNEKADIVKQFCSEGFTAMVGDGINDAPALTVADLGVAIGTGADIAVDAADVVVMKNSVNDVFCAFMLGNATLRNIKENLFWAFIYNIICIPLAAGVFIPLFNLGLNPMLASAAMSLSSICVVSNALRLKKFKLKTKGEKKMNVTLNIEGMMCPHCSGRVKQALESIDGVICAEVSHETGTAVIELCGNVSIDILKSAVENAGYKVILSGSKNPVF